MYLYHLVTIVSMSTNVPMLPSNQVSVYFIIIVWCLLHLFAVLFSLRGGQFTVILLENCYHGDMFVITLLMLFPFSF